MKVCFANDYRASVLQPRDYFSVSGRNPIFEQLAGGGGANASGINVVFQRDGDAVERSPPLPASLLILHDSRGCDRLFSSHGDEGIQRWIVPVDALKARLSEVDGRCNSPTEHL
jgi:hypothetical protein